MSSTDDFDAKHIYVVHKTVDEENYFVDLRKSSDNLPNAYFVPKFGKTWFNKVAVNGLGTTNDELIHTIPFKSVSCQDHQAIPSTLACISGIQHLPMSLVREQRMRSLPLIKI